METYSKNERTTFMREQLKQEIQNRVTVIDTSALTFTDVRDYQHLAEGNVWNKAIQAALDEKKNVFIPNLGHPIFLAESIFMDSGCNLDIALDQEIRLCPKVNTCMIRNRNIRSGNAFYVEQEDPDEQITVNGGIWCSEGNGRLRVDKFGTSVGGFAHLLFSNVKGLNVTNITILGGATSYAVQITNAHDFYVDHISFYDHRKDGVHIDGPAKYGIIRNLKGSNLGDDMVALLAWDWYASGVTHGDIEYVLVEHVEGDDNEIRLLSGRKEYPNKKTHDCAVRNCVIEDVSGIYTYKMYYQPNCANVEFGTDYDSALNVGEMSNIYFKDISFPCLRESGFNDIPVYGLFDILADCENLNFENISISQSWEDLEKKNIRVVNAGPISAPYKVVEDPKEWGELFDPNAICTVKDIHLKNVTFCGQLETDPEKLFKETKQSPNSELPKLGGNGYGIIEEIEVTL